MLSLSCGVRVHSLDALWSIEYGGTGHSRLTKGSCSASARPGIRLPYVGSALSK